MSDSQGVHSSATPLLAALEALADCDVTEPLPTYDPPSVLPPNLADLKCKSKTFPPTTINKSAHLFLRIACAEITALSHGSAEPGNPAHKDALFQLKTYTHFTIKEADKGGCVVVLDNDHYKKMCLDILKKKKIEPVMNLSDLRGLIGLWSTSMSL